MRSLLNRIIKYFFRTERTIEIRVLAFNKPIPGAYVSFRSLYTQNRYIGYTNDSGIISFKMKKNARHYSVMVHHTEYEAFFMNYDLNPAANAIVVNLNERSNKVSGYRNPDYSRTLFDSTI